MNKEVFYDGHYFPKTKKTPDILLFFRPSGSCPKTEHLKYKREQRASFGGVCSDSKRGGIGYGGASLKTQQRI
jgi:hypothetical protein